MLEQLDLISQEEGSNRSKILRSAVELLFHQRTQEAERRQRQDDIEQAIQIQDELRRGGGSWDGLQALRDGRDEP